MKRLMIVAILIGLVPVGAQGQLKEQDPKNVDISKRLTTPAQPQGLLGMFGLTPDRFSMQQSYSMSFMTFGGHSFSQGMYLNTMQLQLSDPLLVYAQWGLLNQPLGFTGTQALSPNRMFLSGAGVSYRPFNNMSIQFEYSSLPYGYYTYPAGLSRWRSTPDR